MEGRSVSNEKAKLVVESLQQGRAYRLLGEDLDWVGNGDPWPESKADGAAQQLLLMKARLLEDGKRLDVNSFDRDPCVVLHRELDLPPDLIAQEGFWRWLAVEKFADIVESRARGESARLRNYGINASTTANTIAILWFRADMVYDAESEDPYHLARQPAHTDFWNRALSDTATLGPLVLQDRW